MKSVVRWTPRLKSGKQLGKDDIVECKQQLSLDRLAAIVAIGVLLIGMSGAILAISGPRLRKNAPPKLDAAGSNVQNTQQAVAVGSKATDLNQPAKSTPGYPSSASTQGIVLKGLPGSLDQTPPVTKKSAPRRYDIESYARERRVKPQSSVVAQKSRYARYSKRKSPKAFIMYLEAHQDLLRKIQRGGQTASASTKE
jgi:hypothetical protein